MNAALSPARDGKCAPANRTAQAISRFAEPHRAAISRIASRHPRLADLAISFPALLFSMAVPRRGFEVEPVIARAIAGEPLAQLAASARVPMWMRKLHPLAFDMPLTKLPDSFEFRRQIANHLPAKRRRAALWLQVIAFAGHWGHEDLAIWCARHFEHPQMKRLISQLPRLAVWAWYSRRPDTWAGRIMRTRWTPDMSCPNARDALDAWMADVESHAFLSAEARRDVWARSATVDDFAFEPVDTAEDLVAAASALKNCSRSYAGNIACDRSRIWLVKKRGEPVAMLSLSSDSIVRLGEVSGPRNSAVPPEVALAVARWFRTYHTPRLMPRPCRSSPQGAWQALWKPYWLAKRRIPDWLPLKTPRSPRNWLMPAGSRRRIRGRWRPPA